MKRLILLIPIALLLFAQTESKSDSVNIEFHMNDSIKQMLDSLIVPRDTIGPLDAGEIEVTDQTLRKVENFYASGLNNRGFFLSRNITPKVRNDQKSHMLFSFFTTSCIPCRKEIPFLEKHIKKYGMKKAFLINVGEQRDIVSKYIDHYQYKMPVLLDPYGVVAKKLDVKTTPVMVIISVDGDLLYRHNGFSDHDTTEILQVFDQYFGANTNGF